MDPAEPSLQDLHAAAPHVHQAPRRERDRRKGQDLACARGAVRCDATTERGGKSWWRGQRAHRDGMGRVRERGGGRQVPARRGRCRGSRDGGIGGGTMSVRGRGLLGLGVWGAQKNPPTGGPAACRDTRRTRRQTQTQHERVAKGAPVLTAPKPSGGLGGPPPCSNQGSDQAAGETPGRMASTTKAQRHKKAGGQRGRAVLGDNGPACSSAKQTRVIRDCLQRLWRGAVWWATGAHKTSAAWGAAAVPCTAWGRCWPGSRRTQRIEHPNLVPPATAAARAVGGHGWGDQCWARCAVRGARGVAPRLVHVRGAPQSVMFTAHGCSGNRSGCIINGAAPCMPRHPHAHTSAKAGAAWATHSV